MTELHWIKAHTTETRSQVDLNKKKPSNKQVSNLGHHLDSSTSHVVLHCLYDRCQDSEVLFWWQSLNNCILYLGRCIGNLSVGTQRGKQNKTKTELVVINDTQQATTY